MNASAYNAGLFDGALGLKAIDMCPAPPLSTTTLKFYYAHTVC